MSLAIEEKFAPKTPAPLLAFNALGRPARRFVNIDANAVIDSVNELAGNASPRGQLERPEWEEGLRRYAAAVAKAPVHLFGALHVRNFIKRSVAQRVYLNRERHRLKGLSQSPLVVCGLPRSGTTFLHRLLAEAAQTRALPLWELADPIRPSSGPDRRLEKARRRNALMRKFPAFDMDAIHHVRPELPDECSHLFKGSFRSAIQWQVPAYEWLDWHMTVPAWDAYRDWRDWLALLEVAGLRYVLKDPYHVRHLRELFAVVPDAMVVRTHRDPLETLPSWHKLILNVQAILCERLDVPRIVEATTRWELSLTTAALTLGDGVPKARVYDLDYRRLIADPVDAVRAIHEHFGLDWGEELQARIERYARENTQRKFGENHYSIEEFGQSEADLKRRFAPYREAFGLDRPIS